MPCKRKRTVKQKKAWGKIKHVKKFCKANPESPGCRRYRGLHRARDSKGRFKRMS